MIYDGKTYRNLESQVAYLTEVAKELSDRIEEVAANIPSKMVVEELPDTGDPNITYYVGPKGTEPNLYYEVWVWVQEEPDGPFVWRELEDTDSVDLSGYLPKDETVTTNRQVYTKAPAGTQEMVDVSTDTLPYAIPRRIEAGQLNVPATPTGTYHATSKKYVDDNFVAKQITVTSTPQAYVKNADGTQTLVVVTEGVWASGIPLRSSAGQVNVPATPTSNLHAASKEYVDGNFVAKDTSVAVYTKAYIKKPDGTQGTLSADSTPQQGFIVRFGTNGKLKCTDPGTTPDDWMDVVNRNYLDLQMATKQKKLYIHETTVNFTIGGSTYSVKLHCVDTMETAYTTLSGTSLLGLFTDRPYSVTCVSDSSASATDLLPIVNLCVSRNYSGNGNGIGFRITKANGYAFNVDGIDPVYNTSISNVSVVDGVLTLN